MDGSRQGKWYEKKALVVTLLFAFLPMGLYGLAKSPAFGKKAKFFIGFLIFGFFVFLMSLETDESTAGSGIERIDEKMQANVLDEEVVDIPGKTQVSRSLLVGESIDTLSLKQIILQNHNQISKKTGFKYRENPTSIYVYAYSSKEHFDAGMRYWVGMSSYTHGSELPSVSLKKEAILAFQQGPVIKHGLNENDRKFIYRESWRCEKMAREKFRSECGNDIWEHGDKEKELLDSCESKLLEKWGVPHNVMGLIVDEGIRHNWLP